MADSALGWRAVIVDEHPLWLEGVERALAGVGVEVVGKTRALGRALELTRSLQPDLVVAELYLAKDGSDVQAWLAEFNELEPRPKLIVLSQCEEKTAIEEVLAGGASAYLLKRAHPGDLAVAVRQSFAASIHIRGSRTWTVPPNGPTKAALGLLTRREIEILELAAEGLSNAAIGELLWVTKQTVKFHLANVYRKIGVKNRTEAGRWAHTHGVSRPKTGGSDSEDASSA